MEIWRQESPIGCCVPRSAHGILKAKTCLNGDSFRNHEFHERYPISEEPPDTNSPRLAADQTRDQNLNEFLRPLPAPFLNKTYQLVDDPATDDIISWSEDGTTFVVWRPVDFAKDVLPYHFKHNNLSSFVRQLNTYGFRKVVPERWEFGNDFFRKGSKHLLNDIHRRKTPMSPCIVGTSPKQASPLNDSVCEHATSSSSPLEPMEAKLSYAQTDEAERLKKENMLLFSELSCLRKLGSDLLLYIKTQVKGPLEYPSSIAKFLQNGDVSEDASTDGSFTDRDKRSALDNNVYHTLQAHADDEICSSSLVSQRENLELRFVMPQKSEIGAVRQINERSPPRLFGVPLPCRKKDTVSLFKAV